MIQAGKLVAQVPIVGSGIWGPPERWVSRIGDLIGEASVSAAFLCGFMTRWPEFLIATWSGARGEPVAGTKLLLADSGCHTVGR